MGSSVFAVAGMESNRRAKEPPTRIWGLTRNTGLGKHVTEHRDPGVTLHDAAAPHATLRFVLYALPVGLAFLVPSLWLLFRVFMGTLPFGPTV